MYIDFLGLKKFLVIWYFKNYVSECSKKYHSNMLSDDEKEYCIRAPKNVQTRSKYFRSIKFRTALHLESSQTRMQ